MNIGRFSVRNPVLINILMVSLLLLGVFSIQRLPKEQYAEVPFFWANILIPYPGVSAEDVEKSVTVDVENAMENLDSLKRITSVSSEGLSLVRVEFDDGISDREFRRLFQEVQTQLSKVELPDGTRQPSVDDFSAADFLPVIEVVLSGDVPFETLNREAEELEELLTEVPDLAGVESVGTRDRQILVEARPARLEALGVSLDEIVRAVQQRNVTVPGGALETETREYLLRTLGELKNSREFGRVIVRRSAEGGLIHIDDAARVRSVLDPKGITARYNGEPAITLKISKVSGGDSLKVTGGVKERLAEFRQRVPAAMEVTVFSDTTIPIRNSISTLVNNFLAGFLLLVFILFLFIGLRNALITALGIPVTFAMTFLVLEAMGETLNSNTLFGLVLVLGLVVDHAIVIIENSYRLQQQGLSRIDAAVEGANQVVIPVIAATATTVAAFLPLMILPGTIGKFLRVIPLTVSIALIVSTLEALTFLPVHFAEWAGKAPSDHHPLFDRFRRRYRRILDSLYRRRKRAVGVMVLILLGSFSLVATVQQDLFSADDFSLFYIDIDMPPGTAQAKTDQTVRRFEERLLPLTEREEITGISTSVGFAGGDSGNTVQGDVAQIIVNLAEFKKGRNRSVDAVLQEVEALCAGIPGPEEVRYRKATNGPPTSPPVSYRLRGDSNEALRQASREIQEKLRENPDLYNITDTVEKAGPELQVRVNEEEAARYGLSPLAVGSHIRSALEGTEATTIFRDNRRVDVIVRLDTGGISRVDQILQMKIPTPDGRFIPFTSVARLEQGDSVASIQRVDGKREVSITAEAFDESGIPGMNERISREFRAEMAPRYPNMELITGGEFAELEDLLIQILRIFLIGVFLIYTILGTQFRSYAQPFIILFAIPFSFIGIILFLVLTGTPFSTTVLYAGVALAGIAVNDSIVLISFINRLREEENHSTAEAVMEASTTRLRPILLTSITTIAGLIPTALGIGGTSVVWGPMASTIIFGLLFSTATALLLIPCLYGSLDDIKQGLRRRVSRSPAPGSAPEGS